MISIMEELHKYVPMKAFIRNVTVEETERPVQEQKVYPLCLGGD